MESRESIKKRMLNVASAAWGLSGGEDETSFDPVVELLITACAAEIEKISRESKISQSRLMEKLAQVLCPDAQVGALSAHAIASASPVEPIDKITPDHQFWYQKRSSERDFHDLYFTPTSDFTLLNAEVKYVLAKDTFVETRENRYKESVFTATDGKRISPSRLILGISVDQSIKEMDALTFYFDIKSEISKDLFYHYLSSANWYHEHKMLHAEPGYASDISGEYLDVKKIIERKTGVTDKTAEAINRFYKKRFVTLNNVPLKKLNRNVPASVTEVFGQKCADKLPKDILWLEIQFSTVIADDVLKEVMVSLNSFPILNRKFNDFTFRLHETLNIVPLTSNEFFLDLKSVSDTYNKSYIFKEITNNLDLEEGDMVLRYSGVGRFDQRDAKELTHYLLEALRDECASYSLIGLDSITNSITQLNKLITNLEDKVLNHPIRSTVPYLLIRSNQANKNLFVEFWSTSGSLANHLKPGMMLESVKGIDLKNKSSMLLTVTTGGRDRLSDEEKMNVFKGCLISKGQVVTTQDLKTFCLQNLPNKVKRIEIKKGISSGISNKAGLTRTIDIIITPKEPTGLNDEWNYLLEDLKLKLEDVSFNIFPFRFILN